MICHHDPLIAQRQCTCDPACPCRIAGDCAALSGDVLPSSYPQIGDDQAQVIEVVPPTRLQEELTAWQDEEATLDRAREAPSAILGCMQPGCVQPAIATTQACGAHLDAAYINLDLTVDPQTAYLDLDRKGSGEGDLPVATSSPRSVAPAGAANPTRRRT